MVNLLSSVYRRSVIEHPRTALLLVVVLLILMAAGLPRFKLDASSDSLTLEHDQSLDYFREISQRYGGNDFLVVTFKPNQDLFSDSSLATLKSLTGELQKVPGVASTLSMLDAPLLYSPKVALTQIGNLHTLTDPNVDRSLAKQEFLNSPIYKNLLLGPDGETTAIMLNLAVDDTFIDLVRHRDALSLKESQEGPSDTEAKELERVRKEFLDYRTQKAAEDHARVEQVRSIVANYEDRAQLFVGGASMITADMINFIRSDLKVFGIGVLAFMVVIMAVIFRQKRFVFLPIATCLTSVIMMLGFLSWIDWRLTVISSNFVALLLIISLAITIHLLVRYREYHAESPELPQSELVMRTVSFMALPCFYTTLTTMVAFVSLVVSDIRPVIDFGWMMTIGLALSFVLAFVIIPAGLMILPKGEPRDKGDNSHVFTTRFSSITERFPTGVLVVSVLLGMLSVYGISKLEVENRFIDYFHKSTEIYKGMSVIDKNLGGTISLDIVLDAPKNFSAEDTQVTPDAVDPVVSDDEFGGDAFADPDLSTSSAAEDSFAESSEEDPFGESDPFGGDNPFASADNNAPQQDSYWFTVSGLQQIKKLHDYLDSRPEIGKVQSLAIAYQVGSDITDGSLNNFELALMKRSLPGAIEDVLINPYLDESIHQTRITLRVKDTSPNLHRAQLLEDIHKFAVEEAGFSDDQVHFTGLLVLYNNMLQSLFKSQIMTLGAVFIGIACMFVVLFRSLPLALIAIVPNLLAAAVVLGGMGLAGIPLDMMTITIAAITVGIGVDDTIHYIHRFKTEFGRDRDYIATMHRSHASIGRAMFYTSVIIILGFSIMGLSRFIPTIYFGLLTGLAMLAAILAALLLLPRLILLFKPFGPQSSSDTIR